MEQCFHQREHMYVNVRTTFAVEESISNVRCFSQATVDKATVVYKSSLNINVQEHTSAANPNRNRSAVASRAPIAMLAVASMPHGDDDRRSATVSRCSANSPDRRHRHCCLCHPRIRWHRRQCCPRLDSRTIRSQGLSARSAVTHAPYSPAGERAT